MIIKARYSSTVCQSSIWVPISLPNRARFLFVHVIWRIPKTEISPDTEITPKLKTEKVPLNNSNTSKMKSCALKPSITTHLASEYT